MFAVLLPVGPKEIERRRLADTLDSLRAHEDPSDIHLVLVDDAPAPRADLVEIDWPTPPTVVRTGLWDGERPPYFKSALIAGAVDGLRAAARFEPEFCLKLDTDALVIGSFSQQIRAAFTADPSIGMVGSHDRRCTGELRDWSHKGWVIQSAARPFNVSHRSTRFDIPTGWWFKERHRRQRVRQLIDMAQANGYTMGEHCLGGAYAVSQSFLRRGDLLRWRPWVNTWDCGEDVVVSLLVRAAGLRIQGMVDRGQPFGLAFQGLPQSPEWLVDNGYSLVHSLKGHQGADEDELRQWFREHTRPTPRATPVVAT